MPSDRGAGAGWCRVRAEGAPERVAGALAELGVTGLELRLPGEPARVLAPRQTDLPGLLRSAPAGAVLVAGAPGITVVVETGALAWSAADPAVRRRLEQIIGGGD